MSPPVGWGVVPRDAPRKPSGFLLHRMGWEGRRGFSRSKKSVGGCDRLKPEEETEAPCIF